MEAQYKLLREFTQCLKANPDILHEPKLAFFRDYLESLGATIPEKSAPASEEHKKEEEKPAPAQEDTPMEEEEEQAIPMPDLDNSGVIEADSGEELPMGEEGKEATEEELDQANEARDRAMAAFSDGNFEESVKEYTTAITLNPGSAIMHAKRANALLKLKKPVAAIADCNMAIKINPDSAQGYKFRGRANRLLGKWVEAHSDLAMACKLDYDDTANEWLKEVEPNAKKLQEYNRAVARSKEEKELRERRERVRRAQEANAKAAAEEAKKVALFKGLKLEKRDGHTAEPSVVLAGKVIGLYFSAHWCPPCKQFTPILKDFYEELAGEGFEVVFMSMDKSEQELKKYMAELHGDWFHVPFASQQTVQAEAQKYGIAGIPALVIVKPDGTVITKNGRADVEGKAPSAALRDWKRL